MKTAEIKNTLATIEGILYACHKRTRSPAIEFNIETISQIIHQLQNEIGLLAQRKFKDGYDKAIADQGLPGPTVDFIEIPVDFGIDAIAHEGEPYL